MASLPIINNMHYITVARIFLLILPRNATILEPLFYGCLNTRPYHDLNDNLRQILSKFLAFGIESQIERYLKGIFIDLRDAVWNYITLDFTMQV